MFRRRPQPHEHRWVNVNVDQGWEDTLPGGGKRPKTLLLKRCRCGAHDTEFIIGTWSREDLGIDDDTVRDLLALLNEID